MTKNDFSFHERRPLIWTHKKVQQEKTAQTKKTVTPVTSEAGAKKVESWLLAA